MSEEIKAPVIEGYKNITVREWQETPSEESINLYSGFKSKAFYYRRIKPKEKSSLEIIQDFAFKSNLMPSNGLVFFLVLFLDYVKENYVKKEGRDEA